MPEKKREYKGSTDATRRAVKKYDAGLGHIKLRITPEEKKLIAEAAEAAGLSINMYVKQTVLKRVHEEL